MDFRELVKRYQNYDAVTGEFNVQRTDRQYSLLLGVERALLSRFYAGLIQDSHTMLSAFLRTFPMAAGEVAQAMRMEMVEETREPAGVS